MSAVHSTFAPTKPVILFPLPYVCICVCVQVRIYVCMYMHVYTYVYMCMQLLLHCIQLRLFATLLLFSFYRCCYCYYCCCCCCFLLFSMTFASVCLWFCMHAIQFHFSVFIFGFRFGLQFGVFSFGFSCADAFSLLPTMRVTTSLRCLCYFFNIALQLTVSVR